MTNAMTARESCAGCRFWDRYDDEGLLESQRRVGDCRRRPPLISETIVARVMPPPHYNSGVGLADAMEPETLYIASAFPVTHEESWCGEFEAPSPVVPL